MFFVGVKSKIKYIQSHMLYDSNKLHIFIIKKIVITAKEEELI